MSEFLRIAQQLFEKHRRPMSAAELVNLAYEDKMFSDKFSGKTPKQTMKSKLSVHIRRHGENSPFVRTKPGKFYLRRMLTPTDRIYYAPPLQPPPASERVLVFPSTFLDDGLRFQGLKKHCKRLHERILKKKHCKYMDRLLAEQDDSHKQVLTYILVTRGPQVLSYKRGSFNRVEDFLRGAFCVGFGGHVTEADLTLFNESDLGLRDSAIRELSEELLLPEKDHIRLGDRSALTLVGAINDDSSSTGRRHIAFVFRYEVSGDLYWDRPQRREQSITQLQWIQPTVSARLFRRFEYWSQLVLRELFRDYVSAQPSYLIRKRRPLRPPHTLCVLGPVGSGKTETAAVLTGEYGYREVNSGRILANLLGVPPIPESSREEFQDLSWRFIAADDGPKRLATAIAEEVCRMSSDRILIDGIRQRTTLNELRALMRSQERRLGAVFVHTPPDVAFRFYRSRLGSPISIDEFLAVRDAPVELDTYGMIGLADAVLYNWSGKVSYRDIVGRLMRDVTS